MEFSFLLYQFELKSLKKNLFFCKSVNLTINLYKLETLYDNLIVEGLFLLEFFSGSKAFINHYKKNYKEFNIQLMNNINFKNFNYFFNILKIFYLPVLSRRNILFFRKDISLKNFNLIISNVNTLNFIPDIYFKWKKPIICSFTFRSMEYQRIVLYLHYIGFNFSISNNLLKSIN